MPGTELRGGATAINKIYVHRGSAPKSLIPESDTGLVDTEKP